MSKRKTTPKLPSMDELLDADAKESKSQDSSTSGNRVKVTYYLPADLVGQIDDVHYELNRLSRGRNLKIHKYDMARVAWYLVLQEFERTGINSDFAKFLLGNA